MDSLLNKLDHCFITNNKIKLNRLKTSTSKSLNNWYDILNFYNILSVDSKYFNFLVDCIKITPAEIKAINHDITNAYNLGNLTTHSNFLYLIEVLYFNLDIELLDYILKKKKIKIIPFYVYLLIYITDFSNSFSILEPPDTPLKSKLKSNKDELDYYYISFITIIIKNIEILFNTDTIKLIINNINLNTVISKKHSYILFNSLYKYLQPYHFNNYDNMGFSILLDAAKYSDFFIFKNIFKKTEEDYWSLFSTSSCENILIYSLKNTDTRIFEFILNNTKLALLNYYNIQCEYVSLIRTNQFKTQKILFKIKQFYTYLQKQPDSAHTKSIDFIGWIAINSNPEFFKKLNKIYDFSIIYNNISNSNSILKDSECTEIIFNKINKYPNNKKLLTKFLYNTTFCIHNDYSDYILNHYNTDIDFMHLLSIYSTEITNGNYNCKHCKDFNTCINTNFTFFNNKLKIMDQYKSKSITIYSYYNDTHTENIIKNKIKNKILIKNIFINGIYNYIKIDFYPQSEYYKSWLNTIAIFKKIINKKFNKHKTQHNYNFKPIINYITLNSNRNSLKYNRNNKFNNPNPTHITIDNTLKLLNSNIIYITEKADGIKTTINALTLEPPIKNIPDFIKFNNTLNLQSEKIIINSTPIHFIFGSNTTINFLRDKHMYITQLKYDIGIHDLIYNKPFSLKQMQQYQKYEQIYLYYYIKKYKDIIQKTNKKLWWPKLVWPINTTVLIDNFELLKNTELNIFPTDGWILTSCNNDLLKLKSDDKLTIDLLYKNNTFYDADNNSYDNVLLRSNIRENIENIVKVSNVIYRCYYNKDNELWIAKDIRHDKKTPNSYDIVNTIINYFNNTWSIEDIIHYSNSTKYYQNSQLDTTKLYKNKTIGFGLKSNYNHKQFLHKILQYYSIINSNINSNILDLGCGYTNTDYFKLMNFTHYVGVDIDYNIILQKKKQTEYINPNKNYFLLDFNKNWMAQLKKQNKYGEFKDIKFDTILCLNSIHNTYTNFKEFINQISHVSNNKCTLIIKFLNNTSFNLLLQKHNKTRLHFETNWVHKINDNQIKYYYGHCHQEPIIEYMFGHNELICGFKTNSWELLEHIKLDDYIESNYISSNSYLWDKYLQCFEILVFRFNK